MRKASVGFSLFAEKIADMGYEWLQSRWDNCADIQAAFAAPSVRKLVEQLLNAE